MTETLGYYVPDELKQAEKGEQAEQLEQEQPLQLAGIGSEKDRYTYEVKQELDFERKYNESIINIGQKEIDIFNVAYNINPGDSRTFVDKVTKIQTEIGSNITGIIDKETLKSIYINSTEGYFYKRDDGDENFSKLSDQDKIYIDKKINEYLNIKPEEKNEVVKNNDRYEKIDKQTDKQTEKLYNKSVSSVGLAEVEGFMHFFDITDKSIFVSKLKELQSENGLKHDGVMGSSTIELLYRKYYKNNQEKADSFITRRLEIIDEMQGYKEYVGKGDRPDPLYKNLNVFRKQTYFGLNSPVNENGNLSFVDQTLAGIIPDTIENEENRIIIEDLDGKKILKFYISGKLHLATYVSPGLEDKQTATDIFSGTHKLDKYHVSDQYPNPKEDNVDFTGGAVMPLAVHVTRGIWLHGSASEIDGKLHSHGCIRVPLFYIKEIHEKVDEIQSNGGKVVIDTTAIYNNG